MLRDLPDKVCPTFLDKMENANLSWLPPLSPARPALLERALLCLVNDAQGNKAQLLWRNTTSVRVRVHRKLLTYVIVQGEITLKNQITEALACSYERILISFKKKQSGSEQKTNFSSVI